MNKQEAILKLEEVSWECENYFRTIHAVELDEVRKIISQIEEPQKVTIPKFVAEWIGYCKFKGFTLLGALDPVSELGVGLVTSLTEELRKGKDWAQRNQETFTRAWLYGFEIEQEKLYTVEIPDPHGIYKIRYLLRDRMGNIRIGSTDNRDIFLNAETHLTEAEIKQDFEWAFQFAKPVEEK